MNRFSQNTVLLCMHATLSHTHTQMHTHPRFMSSAECFPQLPGGSETEGDCTGHSVADCQWETHLPLHFFFISRALLLISSLNEKGKWCCNSKKKKIFNSKPVFTARYFVTGLCHSASSKMSSTKKHANQLHSSVFHSYGFFRLDAHDGLFWAVIQEERCLAPSSRACFPGMKTWHQCGSCTSWSGHLRLAPKLSHSPYTVLTWTNGLLKSMFTTC